MKTLTMFFSVALLLLTNTGCVAQCAKEPLVVLLTVGFDRDHVEIAVGSKIIFKEIVTTDQSSGLTTSFNVKRDECKQKITVKINGVTLHTMWVDHQASYIRGVSFAKYGISISNTLYAEELPTFE